MSWQVGDMAKLTAEGLLHVASSFPALFARLLADGRVVGSITTCDESGVVVDFDNAGDASIPICPEHPQHLLEQLSPDAAPSAQHAAAAFRDLSPDQIRALAYADNSPPMQVGTAQWCVSQMLEFRKFQVVQQLRGAQDQSGEEWKGQDVQAMALMPEEQQLYVAAMRRIRQWIEQPNQPIALFATLGDIDTDEEDDEDDDLSPGS